MNGQTDANIILPLKGFKHTACGFMLSTQFWAVQMFTKNRHGQTDRTTYKLDWTPLRPFGPHFGYEIIAMLDP